jgi:hypothetical protein
MPLSPGWTDLMPWSLARAWGGTLSFSPQWQRCAVVAGEGRLPACLACLKTAPTDAVPGDGNVSIACSRQLSLC